MMSNSHNGFQDIRACIYTKVTDLCPFGDDSADIALVIPGTISRKGFQQFNCLKISFECLFSQLPAFGVWFLRIVLGNVVSTGITQPHIDEFHSGAAVGFASRRPLLQAQYFSDSLNL